MQLKERVKLPADNLCDQFYLTISEGLITVTSSACQCGFWQSMRLPCRHILAVRESLGVNLFDEALCDGRWSMEYYKANQRIFLSPQEGTSSQVSVISVPAPKKRILSQFEKFHKVSKVTTKLPSLASEESGSGFHKRFNLLEQLVSEWGNGKCVSLCDEITGSDDSDDESEIDQTDTTIQSDATDDISYNN